MRAVEQNRAETLTLLIQNGADPTLPNELGITPIFAAVTRHHFPVLRVLVGLGKVYVNEENSEGEVPIVYAVEGGYPRMTELLLQKGADINRRRKKDGASLLNVAILCRHNILASWLLQQGVKKYFLFIQ